MTDKPTYTANEVATVLCVSVRKILALMRSGQIAHAHVNKNHNSARISKEELTRLMSKGV
jgi:hypothetical protein